MASKKMVSKLNEQIKNEWYSQYLYLDMMAWCYNNNYDGFAQWFQKQAGEEFVHGAKIVSFLNDINADIVIPAIDKRNAKFTDVDQLFKLTLEHEQKVTATIHNLAKLATEEDDYPTLEFLQWYVKEQVEEENTARTILSQLDRIKGSPGGLFMLEAHLGKRE